MGSVKSGDIIGTCVPGAVSSVINLGTFGLPYRFERSGVSHVGIIVEHGNEPYVYESTTTERLPCALQKRRVKGCQAHTLEQYLEFISGKVLHYPLRAELYEHEKRRLRYLADRDLGRPYDLKGAIRSGGFMYRTINKVLRKEDAAAFFCSEWCARLLVEIGVFRTRNYSSWNPNKLVRTGIKRGLLNPPRLLKKGV